MIVSETISTLVVKSLKKLKLFLPANFTANVLGIWDEKNDFDAYFATRVKELVEGGFFSKLVPLLTGETKMTFSEIKYIPSPE